jgi:hypothetical protein
MLRKTTPRQTNNIAITHGPDDGRTTSPTKTRPHPDAWACACMHPQAARTGESHSWVILIGVWRGDIARFACDAYVYVYVKIRHARHQREAGCAGGGQSPPGGEPPPRHAHHRQS